MAEQDDRFEQGKAHFLRGLGQYQAAEFAAAEQSYRASLALVPGRASTLINLAATQLRLARSTDALASADAALAVEGDSTDAWLHRGTALAQLGRAAEALAAFDRLLEFDPAHTAAWSSRGSLLREMQRLDDAAQAFRRALQLGAQADLHDYYLASVGAGAQPPTAPKAYVVRLFDDYAAEFDQHLVGQLHYQAHRQLVQRLTRVAGAAPYVSALDLGCGTGLCGPLVRPMVRRLTGVDLSARTLDRARTLGIYDQLEHADVVQFMRAPDATFDLLLAADVFIYVGDLQPVFESARRVMAQGVFCFSVELAPDEGPGFQLLPSLRYAHSRRYLLQLAAAHGFESLAMEHGPVRQDQLEPVGGLYVYLRRGA